MKNFAKDLGFKFDYNGIKGSIVISEISFEVKDEKKWFAIMDKLTHVLEDIFEVPPESRKK